MYSFDGKHRRKPVVSLGGVSKKVCIINYFSLSDFHKLSYRAFGIVLRLSCSFFTLSSQNDSQVQFFLTLTTFIRSFTSLRIPINCVKYYLIIKR